MAILFLDGLVIDGNGGLTERGAVLVDGDHIVATGTSAQLEARRRDPDTMTLDLRGRPVLRQKRVRVAWSIRALGLVQQAQSRVGGWSAAGQSAVGAATARWILPGAGGAAGMDG